MNSKIGRLVLGGAIFVVSCSGKVDSVPNQSNPNAEVLISKSVSVSLALDWYAHQKLAGEQINLVTTKKIDIASLIEMSPESVLAEQHAALGYITDISVFQDDRWNIVEDWYDEQLLAVDCLRTAAGSTTRFRPEQVDLDWVFEIQEGLLREIRKQAVSPLNKAFRERPAGK